MLELRFLCVQLIETVLHQGTRTPSRPPRSPPPAARLLVLARQLGLDPIALVAEALDVAVRWHTNVVRHQLRAATAQARKEVFLGRGAEARSYLVSCVDG